MASNALLNKLQSATQSSSFVVTGKLVDIVLPDSRFDDGNWHSAIAIIDTEAGQRRWLWPVVDEAGEPKLWRLLSDADLAKLAAGQVATFSRVKDNGRWHTSIKLS